MRKTVTGLLAIPAALLTVIFATPAYSQDWPYNLPPGAKYYPEHEHHIRRDLEIQQKLNLISPCGMRKMSDDEGEKFFLDYWQFDQQAFDTIGMDKPLHARRSVSSAARLLNISNVEELLPPLLLHAESQQFIPNHRFLGRSLFERAYQCPSGTNSCESIGYPNSCCATGETCISLPDNDGATIGCCPDGASCGGQIGSCDTAAGYTNCKNDNGGCCIPGYTCQGIGCVYASTATTTTTLPIVTVTTGASWSTLSDSTTTQTFVIPASSASQPGSICTTTTTLVVTTSGNAMTTTVVETTTILPSSAASTTSLISSTQTSPSPSGQGPLTCSPGFQTCPASLGGGCCPTDRACGSLTCPPLSTAVPPVLPTSGTGPVSTSALSSVTETHRTTSTSNTVSYSGCPTGFYMCSAYYLGGCCRVGRNCDTTSCPTSASTAVATNSGLTVMAPSGASSAAPTGNCANGWFSCAASVGGGCCPSGYGCGTSCTATASGQSNVGKSAPSEAADARACKWIILSLSVLSGVGMIFL
ncbi:hypothetical protein E4T50_16033 [Aureobasidium sp. EXF-12298]|nr:hypothetical protein E4T50_16033 [Aureobasidium sp. EXF-12298]KAI4763784.1 hypothetical protein E4T51_03232 [Aureobasidium sp. EXF-12344]KAI4782562.1 hypothetical protein E4T52_02454 [Aureobasidium sp. EXF-3400]